jgi:hypothetical protein
MQCGLGGVSGLEFSRGEQYGLPQDLATASKRMHFLLTTASLMIHDRVLVSNIYVSVCTIGLFSTVKSL